MQPLDESLAELREAVRLRPADAAAHNQLGVVLAMQGKLDEAIACFERACQLDPHSPELADNRRRTLAASHTRAGNAHFRQGQLDDAAARYRLAIECQPTLAEAYNNLGAVFEKQQRTDEAIACYRRAVGIKPDYAAAHDSLGVLLVRQAHFTEAVACYRRAIAIDPGHAAAHFHLALALLVQGDFAAGWPEYQWRLEQPGARLQALPQPRWSGSDLAGKTILLCAEQGLGDTLQFIRYAALVKQRGARVIVECPASLARLIARCEGVDQVVETGGPLPAFDVESPLLSLPGVLGTRMETIPADVPYLRPDTESVARWRRELGRGAACASASPGRGARPTRWIIFVRFRWPNSRR